MTVVPFLPALVFLLLLVVGMLRDPRRFSNAVLLGLAGACLGFALLIEGDRTPDGAGDWAIAAVAGLLALGLALLPVALIANGVVVVRREGASLGNLLTLLAGVAVLGLWGLLVLAAVEQSRALLGVTGAVVLVGTYIGFLFLSFVGYAFLYGRLPVRRRVDFVVVLGTGLAGGERITPLLASRLDRGLRIYRRRAERGEPPVMLTSGGRGPDEKLPESHAMAAYLAERDVPEEHLLREEHSRTTEENLRFSRELMEQRVPGYRCVVATNNYHVFRAAMLARAEGVDGQVVGAHTAAYFWTGATIREFVAILVVYKWANLAVIALLAVLGSVWAW